jgi:hypothetical protein
MVRPSNQQAYTIGSASSTIGAPVQEARDPTNLDVNYVLYQEWINTSTDIQWQLVSFDSTSGTVLANWVQFATSATSVMTLTGNSGGAVGPTGSNINIVGDGTTIDIVGVPGSSTLTASVIGTVGTVKELLPNSGTTPVVPNGSGQVTDIGTGSITTIGSLNTVTTQLTGLTNHSLLVGAGTPTITNLGVATNGQLPIGSTGADPVLATLTQGPGVSITNGAGSITIGLSGGGAGIDTITPGSGILVVPDGGGNVNFPNGNGIATVGTANTLTTNMASPFTGDFSFQSVTTGDTETLTVTNTSNTANSQAQVNAVVAGTTAGDAWYQATVGSTQSYSWGIDTSTTNRQWKLNSSASATISPSTGTELFIIDPAGSPSGMAAFQFNTPEFFITSNAPLEVVNLTLRQENAADFSNIIAESIGPKSGFFSSGIYDNTGSPIYWSFGTSSSDAGLGNSFCLNTDNAPQGPEGGALRFRVSTLGAVTFNEAYTFPTVDGTNGQVLTTDGSGVVSFQSAGSGGIGTINGDSGSATGSSITLTGGASGAFFTGASSTLTTSFDYLSMTATDNLGNGVISIGGTPFASSIRNNTFVGPSSGNTTATNSGANPNVGIGLGSLSALTNGLNNVTIGTFCGALIDAGTGNIGVGSSLGSLTSGSNNIAIGAAAGANFTGTESNNIYLAHLGAVESNTIRIGDGSTQTAFYATGVDGVSVTGAAVLCSSSGQLGNVVSSIKVKENIKEIEGKSILDLHPVQFNYISDEKKSVCFGLIAEEVEKVFPELVLYKEGSPYSVKYHEMPALLLNEIQKLRKELDFLRSKVPL